MLQNQNHILNMNSFYVMNYSAYFTFIHILLTRVFYSKIRIESLYSFRGVKKFLEKSFDDIRDFFL